MKKLLLLAFVLFSFSSFAQFEGRTKHKPITRMTVRQVRNAQHGKYLYVHKHGKLVRNHNRRNSDLLVKKRRR